MGHPRWQHGILAAMLLGWAGSAGGQSVDTSMARATVGQPLSMAVQVRGFDWPASRLTPDCIAVQVLQGDSGDEIPSLRVRTVPSGDDGRVLVHIRSPQRVADTVLVARLSLLCGADYTREFTVLVDPPVPGAVPPESAAPRPTTAASATSAPRMPSPREPGRPTQAAGQMAGSAITRADDPPRPAAQGHPPWQEADLQRLASAVAATLATTIGTTLAVPRTATPEPEAHLAPAEQARAMAATVAPWQDLREEQRQTRASLAALQSRIERSERDLWRDVLLVMGAMFGLCAGLLVLRLVREGLMPRVGATDGATRTARRRPGTPRNPPSDGSVANPDEGNADPHAFSLRSAPQPPAPSLAADPAGRHGFVDWTPPPAPPAPPGLDARSRHWPDADFGHPTLEATQASAQLLQELEPHVEESPIGVAVVLERRLQALPGKCPAILLRLLDLYRQMAQPWNHERVAAQLESLYNVRIPAMDAPPAPEPAAAGLESCPDTLERIQQAWLLDDPSTVLATLLLRPTVIEVLDPPAFEEVLLLHAIVQQRQSVRLTAVDGSGAAATPPEPALPEPPASRHLVELLAA